MINYLKHLNKKVAPKHYFFGPEWIVLGVNNVCNLHCKMCDVGTANLETNFAQNLVGSHPLNMPMELFKKIVDQTAEAYPKAKLGYAFTEPLVYPQLLESLLYAKEKGLETTITTNALNLKRKTPELLEGGVKELYISIDGLQETHNYIRGNKQSFQKAVEGIEFIKSFENSPEISVFCVITEWNYTELVAFADYFSRLPIKKVGFLHQNFVTEELASTHNILYGETYRSTHSNIELTDLSSIDLAVLNAEIEQVKAKNYPIEIVFAPNLEGIDILKTFYREPEKKIGKVCNDAFSNVMIKTDGSVIPAHGRCYNVSMGNLYDQTLTEIWNGKTYGQFRGDLMEAGGLFPACSRCCSAF